MPASKGASFSTPRGPILWGPLKKKCNNQNQGCRPSQSQRTPTIQWTNHHLQTYEGAKRGKTSLSESRQVLALLLIGWKVARVFKPITKLVNAKRSKANAYNFCTPKVETVPRKKLLRLSSKGVSWQVSCPLMGSHGSRRKLEIAI